MAKRAVYPGMFDPLHNGHVDVIQRSLAIFDEVIVAVVANPSKQPLFTVEQRLEMIDEATTNLGVGPHLRIVSFDGLLIDLVAREHGNVRERGGGADGRSARQPVPMSGPRSTVFVKPG